MGKVIIMSSEFEFEGRLSKGYVSIKGERISVDLVEFIDIESDEFGIDVMTFCYNGETHRSYITMHAH